LDADWFATLAEAKQLIEVWRKEYNETRAHRVLGESTPNEIASEFAASRELTGKQTAEGSLWVIQEKRTDHHRQRLQR